MLEGKGNEAMTKRRLGTFAVFCAFHAKILGRWPRESVEVGDVLLGLSP